MSKECWMEGYYAINPYADRWMRPQSCGGMFGAWGVDLQEHMGRFRSVEEHDEEYF